MRFFAFLFLIFTGLTNIAKAQPPCATITGMTPQTAIAVCGTTIFTQNNVDNCFGPAVSGAGACGSSNSSDNAFWYKFHCYQAGTLGFLITPLQLTDDYDWELFDVTGIRSLNDIYTNESLMVSLNLCGNPNGITGCSPLGTDSINCGGPTFLFNRLATLQTDHDYMLMVNNWSASNQGYNLEFTGGNAVITDPTVPIINSVATVGCNSSLLNVIFSKDVLCSSVTSSGSEFSITPGAPVITNVISRCTSAFYSITDLTIQLQNPLPTGNYNLFVNPGSDANTFMDVCGNNMLTGFTIPFTVTAQQPVALDTITFTGCTSKDLNVKLTKPVWCNSITAAGSEFSILPGNPAIVSVQSVCSSGGTYADQLQIGLLNPLPPGNYQLFVNNGTDGNTFIDTCGGAITAGSNLSFTISATAGFNSQVKWGCIMDTIVLSHPGGNGANSWIWNFSDGGTASGQTVTHISPVSVPTVDVQLIVSNGICSDTFINTISLGNAYKADFTIDPDDTICINTPVIFTNTSTGNIVENLWDFGDLTQYNGQTPPVHTYALTNNYHVQLIVTNSLGCKDTAYKNIYVAPSAFIDFTGLKPQYCTGNQVLLTRKISRNINSYVWDNGDGKTFVNEVDVNFSYATDGTYTITLSGVDRFCGTAKASKTVPVYAVPLVKLPSDTVLCNNEQILIGVPPTANYTYLWSTGATTSQILTNIFTRDYTLTADNKGCRAFDVMKVKVLPACLIKVPGAFTPNRDGLNDQLKALNADLAKNFSFKVFNRAGQEVFSTTDPLGGWDGIFKNNPADTGTYVWMLSYTDPWTGNAIKEKGTTILLR
jgi:gliding motility-associated-like protein